jgi:hypothetical protein
VHEHSPSRILLQKKVGKNNTLIAPLFVFSTAIQPQQQSIQHMADGVQIFGYIGVVPMAAMFIVPSVHVYQIWQAEDKSPHPNTLDNFCGMWVFCTLWIAYGVLDFGNWVILLPNIIGAIVATIAFFVLWLRAGNYRGRQQTAIIVAVVVSLIFIAVATVVVPFNESRQVASWMCFIGGLIYFSSPIPLIRFVFSTHDGTIIKPGALAATLISCVWQFIYGILKAEVALATANAVGALVSIAGLVAWTRYRNADGASVAGSTAPPPAVQVANRL